MRLRLTTRGIDRTPDLKDHVSARVHVALARFAARVRSVSVRLFVVGDLYRGVYICCEVRVDIRFAQKVIVRERHSHIHAAVAFAIERTERAVQRQLKSANLNRAPLGP